jgi:hypothetical protein
MSQAALPTAERDNDVYTMHFVIGNTVEIEGEGEDENDAFEDLCYEVARQVAGVIGDIKWRE